MSRKRSGIETVTSFFLTAPIEEVVAAMAAAKAVVAVRTTTRHGTTLAPPKAPTAKAKVIRAAGHVVWAWSVVFRKGPKEE